MKNIINMRRMFCYCTNLKDIPEYDTSSTNDLSSTFLGCNNLSNASIQNVINMCLNSNITNSVFMNLNTGSQASPLYATQFNSSYYQNRLAELDAAGWSY